MVIPCRNERSFIEECAHALLQCDLPPLVDMQIYIVDGMSDDGTRDVISSLTKEHAQVHLIDNKKQLTPFAFNLGIQAGGKVDYVQIVGARHILSKNYLFKCIEKLQENSSIWCVGGKIRNVSVNKTGALISAVMSSSFGMGMGNFRTLESSAYTDTVTSPMYPYHVFDKIGFFDEDLIRNQDDDFNFRVSKAGGKLYFIHEIELKYYVRATITGLRKQFFQYGYWKVFVNRKHGTMTTIRQLFPPGFVLYIALLPLLFFLPCWLQWIGIFPIILYLFGLIFFTAKVVHWKEFLPTLRLFPLIHISYGCGYLLGMIDFLLLRKNPSERQKELSR